MISIKTVAACFDKIGWKYHLHEPAAIYTGIACNIPYAQCNVPIECSVSNHWVFLRAVLTKRVAVDCHPGVSLFLSEINAHCYNAKFYLLNGAVVGQSEVPTVNWSQETFLNSLQAVCRYSAMWGDQLAVMASSTRLCDCYGRLVEHHIAPLIGGEIDRDSIDFDMSANRLP